MDKYDFIKQLEKGLAGLSDVEISQALQYYKELFEEAGSEKEQELIANLGSPESIAESIKRESGTVAVVEPVKPEASADDDNKAEQTSGNEQKKTASGDNEQECRTEKLRNVGTIALLIIVAFLTSPLWISIMAAVYAVLFAVLVTVFALVIAFGAVGVAGICAGAAALFPAPPVGLVLLGLGLVFTALTVLCTPYLCKGIFYLCRGVLNGTVRLFHSIFYERRTAA